MATYIVIADFTYRNRDFTVGDFLDSTSATDDVAGMLAESAPILLRTGDIQIAAQRARFLKMSAIPVMSSSSDDHGVANVRLFGAVGDGRVSDTVAVQAAIDSIGPDGGTVYFPAGTYICSSATLVVNRSNIRLLGDPMNSILILKSTTDGIKIGDGVTVRQYVTLEGLILTRAAVGSGNTVNIQSCTQMRILNCNINAGDRCLNINAGNILSIEACIFGDVAVASAILLTNCSLLEVTDCYFELTNASSANAVGIAMQAQNEMVAIIGCRFNDGAKAIENSGGPLLGGTISGCVIRSADDGIRIAGVIGNFPERVAIVGNSLVGTGGAGTGIFIDAGANHCTVVGNCVHSYATANITDNGTADTVASNVAY